MHMETGMNALSVEVYMKSCEEQTKRFDFQKSNMLETQLGEIRVMEKYLSYDGNIHLYIYVVTERHLVPDGDGDADVASTSYVTFWPVSLLWQ